MKPTTKRAIMTNMTKENKGEYRNDDYQMKDYHDEDYLKSDMARRYGNMPRYNRADMYNKETRYETPNDIRPTDYKQHEGDYSPISHYKEPYMQPDMADYEEQRSGSRHVQPLTKQMAMEWVKGLENEDGTTGPHWTMEQVNTVMAQKGIEGKPLDFFLALNLTYSDLSKQFKKYGINNLDAYIDFARAFWLDDADVHDKLAKYYEYVVK